MVVRAVGNASNRAYDAFMPDGELGNQGMRVPFTVDDVLRLARQRFSSTEHEVHTIG